MKEDHQFMLDREKVEEFKKRIIKWYEEHGDKDLPWRRTGDPWAVLVAAFLLRKTTTKQVVAVYERFLEQYPTPDALLRADPSEIKELLRPLGIEHKRTEHLKMLAERISSQFNGRVPCEKRLLKTLPGVGDYIASEVLLIACGKPEPLLDRNMIRVLERVLNIKSTKKRPHTDKKLWAVAKTIVPKDPSDAKKFNFGILDFARSICTARSPKCRDCPLNNMCRFYASEK